jgi:hypothetical protein
MPARLPMTSVAVLLRRLSSNVPRRFSPLPALSRSPSGMSSSIASSSGSSSIHPESWPPAKFRKSCIIVEGVEQAGSHSLTLFASTKEAIQKISEKMKKSALVKSKPRSPGSREIAPQLLCLVTPPPCCREPSSECSSGRWFCRFWSQLTNPISMPSSRAGRI